MFVVVSTESWNVCSGNSCRKSIHCNSHVLYAQHDYKRYIIVTVVELNLARDICKNQIHYLKQKITIESVKVMYFGINVLLNSAYRTLNDLSNTTFQPLFYRISFCKTSPNIFLWLFMYKICLKRVFEFTSCIWSLLSNKDYIFRFTS